jgi:hypothetical protein
VCDDDDYDAGTESEAMGSDVQPLGMSEEPCDDTRVRAAPDVQRSSGLARTPLAMCNRHDAAVLTSVCVCACARLRLHEQTGEGDFPKTHCRSLEAF